MTTYIKKDGFVHKQSYPKAPEGFEIATEKEYESFQQSQKAEKERYYADEQKAMEKFQAKKRAEIEADFKDAGFSESQVAALLKAKDADILRE